MNKKYLTGLLSIFFVGLVAASFLVNSFIITTDISEPFTIKYAVSDVACSEYTGTWNDGTDINVGTFYAGETKLICANITNAGTGTIDYTFSGNVSTVGEGGDLEACRTALGEQSVTGSAEGLSSTVDNLTIIIPDNTPEISNCKFTVSIIRG